MHALLKGEDLRAAIGHAGAALVEQNHAAERCQAPKECAEIGRAPGGFDVRHEARDEQQVKWAFAKNLVGDVDVVALDVVRGRYLYHYTLHAEARESSRRTRLQSGGKFGYLLRQPSKSYSQCLLLAQSGHHSS